MRAIRDALLVCGVALLAAGAFAQTEELTKAQADQLSLDAVALYRGGDSAGALAILERVLAFYRLTDDKSSVADTLYARGVVLAKKGERQKALEAFRESLGIQRALGEGEAAVLHEMAFLLLDMSRLAEAAQTFEEERAACARTADRKCEGEAVHSLAFVAAAQGKSEEALTLFERSLPLRREAGDREGEARTLQMAGMVRARAGQLQPALDSYDRALAIWRELGDSEKVYETETQILQVRRALVKTPQKPPTERQRRQSDQANQLNNECLGRLGAGDYGGALSVCRRARELFQKAGDRGGEAMTLVNQSFFFIIAGDYAGAQKIASEGLALAREIGDTDLQANAINNLGLVYLALAQFPQALTHFERALALYRTNHDIAAANRTLANIAGVHTSLGQLSEAAAMYEKLLPDQRGSDRLQTVMNLAAIYAQQRNFTKARQVLEAILTEQRLRGDPLIRTTLGNLASIHAELGDLPGALELSREAIAISERLGDRLSTCGDLARIAEIQVRQSETTKALELYRQALAGMREIGASSNESGMLAAIGRIYEGRGELQPALDHYSQAIAIEETIRAGGQTEEIKTALAERATDLYARMTSLLVKLDRAAEAFDFSERARARTFLDQLGNTRIDVRPGGAKDLVEEERIARLTVASANRLLEREKARPRAEQDAERIKTLATQLATKRRDYAGVLSRLKLSNPEYASLVTVSPLKLAEVQRLLDTDTTLLSYFVTDDATTVFVLTRESFRAVDLKVKEKDLRAAVEELRAFAGVGGAPSPALARLSTWLVEPVLPYLSTPMIGIVPHGVLHLLPFAALHGKEAGHFFGEDYTLFHLPTASALPLIQQKHKAARGELLALAQGRASGLPPLRYAEKEAEAVARLFETSALIGGAATESALRQRAPDAGILHIAAHGQLNSVTPLFSRLVLGADDDLDTARDGSLEVREIYGLDLKKASLVVLSACQTQLGARSRGDDVVGLTRAFIYAGAPAVLASLWSVDDDATASLMTAFYRKLKEGLGGAAALRAAQAETRREHPDPYHWASFVLTGDPR